MTKYEGLLLEMDMRDFLHTSHASVRSVNFFMKI